MGQRPLTFVRQLLSACTNPTQLLDDATYPSDVIERAREILQNCSGNSIGKLHTSMYMYSVYRYCECVHIMLICLASRTILLYFVCMYMHISGWRSKIQRELTSYWGGGGKGEKFIVDIEKMISTRENYQEREG